MYSTTWRHCTVAIKLMKIVQLSPPPEHIQPPHCKLGYPLMQRQRARQKRSGLEKDRWPQGHSHHDEAFRGPSLFRKDAPAPRASHTPGLV